MLAQLDRAIALARGALLALGAAAAGVMMLHITADVLSRYFLNAPFASTIQVVSAYYMVLVSLAPLAYVAHHEGHILVELFTLRLSARAIRRLDAAVGFVVVGYLGLLTWQNTIEALRRTREGEVWEIAGGYLTVWPMRWVVPVSCAVMAAYVLLRSIRELLVSEKR